jgi:hypothetical protein
MLLTATLTLGVESGVMYRFRYRAQNEIGFGEYSEIAYILSASKPSEPSVITAYFDGNDVVIVW